MGDLGRRAGQFTHAKKGCPPPSPPPHTDRTCSFLSAATNQCNQNVCSGDQMYQDEAEGQMLDELVAFLGRSDIEQFFLAHPNQLAVPSFSPPSSWSHWWDWAAGQASHVVGDLDGPQSQWDLLWQYYTTPSASNELFSTIPLELQRFISDARRLQLCRERGKEATVMSLLCPEWTSSSSQVDQSKMHGMSPKKAHEVVSMVNQVADTLSLLSQQDLDVHHAVDVGAGQVRVTLTI